jgi:hypothetical protein
VSNREDAGPGMWAVCRERERGHPQTPGRNQDALRVSSGGPEAIGVFRYLTSVYLSRVGRNDLIISRHLIPLYIQNKSLIKCPGHNVAFYPLRN